MKGIVTRVPFIVLPLLFSGCAFFSPTQPTSDNTVQTSQNVQHDAFMLRGRVTLGAQTHSFTPCGSQSQMLLTLSDEQLKTLQPLAPHAYDEIYLEAAGTLAPPSLTGYNADYLATFTPTLLNFATQDAIAQCAQPNQSTSVLGDKAQWQARFNSEGVLITQQGAFPAQWQNIEETLTNVRRQYKSDQGTLTLNQSRCLTEDTQTLYGWRATLVQGTDVSKGCGKIANKDATQSVVGTFSAQTLSPQQMTITLKLLADHSAQTLYQYEDASQNIRESGFWQRTKENKVEVVMTFHQGQYLVAKRLFTQTGDELHANQEVINNQTYNINDGGLSLYREY